MIRMMWTGYSLLPLLLSLVAWSWLPLTSGRQHVLRIEKDTRSAFPISSFGFLKGGQLSVQLQDFRLEVLEPTNGGESAAMLPVGLSLHRSDAFNPYLEHDAGVYNVDYFGHSDSACYLQRPFSQLAQDSNEALIKFVFNEAQNKLDITCSTNTQYLAILPDLDAAPSNQQSEPTKCSDRNIPLTRYSSKLKDMSKSFNTSFRISMDGEADVGLYTLFYHNCNNLAKTDRVTYTNFEIHVQEKNGDNFLSAGEMPLPAVYLGLAILFLACGLFWTYILKRNGSELVYRIHWIMAALIYLKSLSLFFHGVNYHKIATYGYHIESWAVLYYITHLLKGALLFFTIVLIGSGWAFIKHILTDREKRIFMIVLPLQVLANVAYIIIEESEEGDIRHNWWKEIFILVDLLCCGAILFPVVWSIRHLQDASQTDGKASVSLEKLKLFRHFYIMVVIYIYFTRIIVYLLKITVPYQYEWLDDVFMEAATFIFFFMTGYKFRPASNNPYFVLKTEDYDEEVLVSSTAINEVVFKRKKFAVGNDSDSESDDAEGMVFFPDSGKKRNEDSHDQD